LTSFKEKTHDSKKNAFENDDFKQDFDTSLEKDLENLSIRNLIHLIHEFHRTQNSINSHSFQNEE
jgi:hypothetical protein